MKIYKKILLGSKDVIQRNNEDEFVTFQLNRNLKEINSEKQNNVFNLDQQYVEERNKSLKFGIYGIVESKFSNCTDLLIEITTDQNYTMYTPKNSGVSMSGKTFTIKTKELSDNGKLSKNIFNYEKGSYYFLFELNRLEIINILENAKANESTLLNSKLIFKINDANKNLFDIIEIPFLFFDGEYELVDFGTSTTEIDEQGESFDVDNDYPFFYDRHWIRNGLNISKNGSVFFPQEKQKIETFENLPGGKLFIDVSLDYESKFGREGADVVLYSDNTTQNPNLDFVFARQNLKWAIGEKVKQVELQIFDDQYVESLENIVLGFDSLINCEIKNKLTSKLTVEIKDDDTPSVINFTTQRKVVKEDQGILNIDFIFSKPIEVPNQSFKMLISNTSTAILDVDYTLRSDGTIGDLEKTLNVQQGDISATTQIKIIDKIGYNLDKTFMFYLSAITNNVEIGNTIPNTEITIENTMNYQYGNYVFPVNYQFGVGAYIANNKANNIYNWRDYDSESVDSSFSRKNGNFKIYITNQGEQVIVDNILYKKGDVVFSKNLSAFSETYSINLPSNYELDVINKKYNKLKYDITIDEIYGYLQNPSGFIQQINTKFPKVEFKAQELSAGTLEEKYYYAISELTDIKTQYNDVNKKTYDYIQFELTDLMYVNGLVFLPNDPYNGGGTTTLKQTKVKNYFSENPSNITFEYKKDSQVQVDSFLLPVGLTFSRSQKNVIQENYTDYSFKNFFTQVGPLSGNQSYSDSNFSSLVVAQPNAGEENNFFYNWNNTPLNTKNLLQLNIKNLGVRPIEILGKKLMPFSSIKFNSIELGGFNNLTLQLPANNNYVEIKNTLNVITSAFYSGSSYSFSFDNIVFYDHSGGFISSGQSIDLNHSVFTANTIVNGVPNYNLVSEYKQILIPISNYNGPIFCPAPGVTKGLVFGRKDIKMKGMMFLNSGLTQNTQSYFSPNNKDFSSICTNGEILFQVI